MAGHTSEMPSHHSFPDDLNPATALEFGPDLSFLVDYPEFDVEFEHIDLDAFCPSTLDGNAPNASQELNNFDAKEMKEDFFYPGFDAPAAEQPESQIFSAQGPSVAAGYLPGEFELPDPAGCDFLRSLQVVGMTPDIYHNVQELPHPTGDCAVLNGSSGANRAALEASSEPNPENKSPESLIDSRRLSKNHQGITTQRRPSEFRIQRRNKDYVKNNAYTPLPQAPRAWNIFEYTIDGELEPSRLFSAEEINQLLFTHPLHSGHDNLKESQLTLRVQKTPAGSAKRFPNGLKCRSSDCPMPGGTIGQGQILIIVDEQQHPDHDIFLNSAYFHLFCIERWCDFPMICATLRVTSEGRSAQKEPGRRNKFRLGSSEEERVVEAFVETCTTHGAGGNPWVAVCPDQQANDGCAHYEPQSLQYRGSLSHQLAVTKLHYGGEGRINLRKSREDRAGYKGANIIRHLGDVSREAELRNFSRTHKNQNQLKPTTTSRIYRHQTHQPSVAASPNQDHGTKRSRDEGENYQTVDHDAGTPPGSREIEDESEGDIELAIIAAQRKRRILEIEDAKDIEREYRLRMVKLQKAKEKKRAREEGNEDGYGTDSKVKMQRVW